MAVPSAPLYDNVRLGGPGGIRVPQEVGDATMEVNQRVSINAVSIGGSAGSNTITLVPFVNSKVPDVAGSKVAGGAEASMIVVTNGGTASTTLVLSAAYTGAYYTLYNAGGNGSNVTLKVTGQTGQAVADGSHQLLQCSSTDIIVAAAAIAN